jgi:SAM-dependent methyltransferase
LRLSEVFDDRYLSFSDAQLPKAATDVDAILQMSNIGPGASFVEIGCGEGRLVREAARRGLRATGVDASPTMVAEARRRAAHEGLAVEIIEWDMRAGPAPGRWDLAASWHTSFGYFDDETCRKMLFHIAGSLREHGVLVIDLVDKDALLPQLKRTIDYEFGGRRVYDRLTYDPLTSRIATHRIYDDNNPSEVRFEVRLLAYPELRTWLVEAGFIHVEPARGAAAATGRLRVTAQK